MTQRDQKKESIKRAFREDPNASPSLLRRMTGVSKTTIYRYKNEVLEELKYELPDYHDMLHSPPVLEILPAPIEEALLDLRQAIAADQHKSSGDKNLINRIKKMIGDDHAQADD